ncbi:MAG TPA: hypothetical protein DDW87_04830, partial [Firmicutes bacterium]|nr:hypothetical protein [Bacillota bacterium]
MADENQGALATKGAVRNWTEEEKDVVWEQAIKAKAEGLPLTEAFRRCAKLLPHRSDAAVGMLYYNVLRKEREEPTLPPVKKVRTEFTVDPKLLEAFQGLPEYMQELTGKMKSLEKQIREPDAMCILKALGQLAQGEDRWDDQGAHVEQLQEEIQALKGANQKLQEDLKQLREA